MPLKMSIEVVKHSDQDYRIIFKEGTVIKRVKFSSIDEAYSFVDSQIEYSHLFNS